MHDYFNIKKGSLSIGVIDLNKVVAVQYFTKEGSHGIRLYLSAGFTTCQNIEYTFGLLADRDREASRIEGLLLEKSKNEDL